MEVHESGENLLERKIEKTSSIVSNSISPQSHVKRTFQRRAPVRLNNAIVNTLMIRMQQKLLEQNNLALKRKSV